MKNIDLQVEVRDEKELKSRISRKLALLDYIPAVLYGLEKKPVSIKVKRKEMSRLLKGHNISSVIFDLHLDKSAKDKEAVIIKEYQRDPISRELRHLDFLRIQMKKEIETSVPVKILNEEIAKGIKEEGGVLQHGLRELHIVCLPADIPEFIEYDIEELGMNEIIRVENIEKDEKIRILNDPSEVLVSIIPPTELKEEELAPEVEGEEGEEEEVMEEPELIGKEKPEEEEEQPAEEQKEPKKEFKKEPKKEHKKDKKE
jgi:large subunit ribosomal protein L25